MCGDMEGPLTSFCSSPGLLLVHGPKDVFYSSWQPGHSGMFHRAKLGRGRAGRGVVGASSGLVLTEDWGLTRLQVSRFGWLQRPGVEGFLCHRCMNISRDRNDLKRHMANRLGCRAKSPQIDIIK